MRPWAFRRQEVDAQFGHLIEAFQYGAPPHGGIALGIDRLVALFAEATSIRDVIAFPKTAAGTDLMVDAPSPVTDDQMAELHISLRETKETLVFSDLVRSVGPMLYYELTLRFP